MIDNDDTEKMEINAQDFMELSKKIFAEAMATYPMADFHSTPLIIPNNINEHSAPPAMLSQEQIWHQVSQLYTAQGNLFPSNEIPAVPVTPVTPDPHNDAPLEEISRMLGL